MARLRSCRVTGRLLAASISNLSVNVSPVNAPALPRLTACQAVRAVRFARAHRAADEAPAQNRWRSRYLGCDAPDGSAGQAGRKYRQLSADYRRERRRQGGGGQVCSPNLARADEPFVAVNCGAIPNDLIESQLFGHERGAFTTSRVRRTRPQWHPVPRRGRRAANADAGEAAPPDRGARVHPGGGETAIKSGARIICATNTDLEAAVAEGCSRRDLYYRINVIPVVIPPLRDGRTTSCRSRNPSCASYRGRFTAISKASRRKPNRFCSSIPGPATCGSCATASRGGWQCYRRSRSMRRRK